MHHKGIIGPNLLSYIGFLPGQYHLSVRKIQSLLKEQLGTTFLLVGAISEAQTKSRFNANAIASSDKTSVKESAFDSC